MSRTAKTGAIAVLVIAGFLLGTIAATAHFQSGGGGNDVMVGHDHNDHFKGNSGCDTLQLRGGGDLGEGGPSGCDDVQGEYGDFDDSVVWDDGSGNDHAHGGGGSSDDCWVGNLDYYYPWPDCERVIYPG